MEIYIEKKVKCIGCDREFKIVFMEGTETDSEYLCQRCKMGDIDIDED